MPKPPSDRQAYALANPLNRADGDIAPYRAVRKHGCREVIPRDMPLDREPYRLKAEDAAKVAAYRLRKWGIEGDGVLVERVATSETAATR
jgi:hypothetical protein